ncbi:Tbingi protein [Trypanosoma theileri]|uniref:Tbingi protein n=1 Tax=Trypanosoma theileri TaxID=67003 RepID=A0A1X0P3J7_9TRYP|nr:Tbingi protein [Trypanosoma theileri]ORC91263.1 Tbingi protein [Trypanosoma theileri]
MTAMIRSLKYLMRCQTRGGSLKESAEQVYHETHPVREFYVRIMKNYPTLVIEPRESPLLTPTLRFGKRARFFTSLENVSADDPEERKREASERSIARHFRRKGTDPPPRTHYEIWTDGSVFLGIKSGAAAMIYKDGELLCTTHRGAGPLACSYTAESVALYEGLQRLLKIILANNQTPCRVSIFTDSLSLLAALETGPLTVKDPLLRLLWNLILQVQRRKARIRLQFIFGHCVVVKNEKSDTEAKKAAELPQRTDTWITDIMAYAK